MEGSSTPVGLHPVPGPPGARSPREAGVNFVTALIAGSCPSRGPFPSRAPVLEYVINFIVRSCHRG